MNNLSNTPIRQAVIVQMPKTQRTVPVERIALFNEDGTPVNLTAVGGTIVVDNNDGTWTATSNG